MKFSELVRLLEKNGFRIIKEKGSIRYYGKVGHDKLIRVDYHGSKEVPGGTCNAILKAAGLKNEDWEMIDLQYSLMIEATDEPDFFTFYSTDLEGFSGTGHSIEDCIYNAKWGMLEHVDLLRSQDLPVPSKNPDPRIIIQNNRSLAAV